MPAEGRKLFELIAAALHEYLLASLGASAGLVVAEDVQWFDPSTVEVLDHLLGVGGDRLPGGDDRGGRGLAARLLAGQGV